MVRPSAPSIAGGCIRIPWLSRHAARGRSRGLDFKFSDAEDGPVWLIRQGHFSFRDENVTGRRSFFAFTMASLRTLMRAT